MKKWLKLWWMFFALGIVADGEGGEGGETEQETQTETEEETETETEQETETEGEADTGEDTNVEQQARRRGANEEIREQKRLRQESEARERAKDEEIANLRRQAPAQASAAQKQREEEDRQLNDPNTDAQTKYWIQANRTLADAKSEAQSARFEAADTKDQTSFAQLAATEGKNYAKYRPLVEEELAKMRRNGQNAPREAIYTFLLGKDMRAAQKAAAGKKKPAADGGQNVNRGKTPGAKSDVRANGKGLSEHEKRRARLENVQL